MNFEMAEMPYTPPAPPSASSTLAEFIESYEQAFEGNNWSALDKYYSKDIAYHFLATGVSEMNAQGAEDVAAALRLMKATLAKKFRVKRFLDETACFDFEDSSPSVSYKIHYCLRGEQEVLKAHMRRTIWLDRNLRVNRISDRLPGHHAALLLKLISENVSEYSKAFCIPE